MRMLWFRRVLYPGGAIILTMFFPGCAHRGNWLSHTDFAYQLQGYQYKKIRDSGFSLFVLDAGIAGNSPERLNDLRDAYPGERRILCYLSIGEAEDYRSYWKAEWGTTPPAFLDEENERWRGNYKVQYWDPDWQKIIYGTPDSLLDKIIALGFDGVYLDIVDGYEHYEAQGRTTAAKEMVEFVSALKVYAQHRKPDFGIFTQNAEELGIRFPEYLAIVDGTGVEDLFYGNPLPGHSSPKAWTQERIHILKQWKKAGKLVLTIDYTLTEDQTEDAYRRSRSLGFVPYATVLSLGTLRVNSGLDPDSLSVNAEPNSHTVPSHD